MSETPKPVLDYQTRSFVGPDLSHPRQQARFIAIAIVFAGGMIACAITGPGSHGDEMLPFPITGISSIIFLIELIRSYRRS